jgi:adenylate cyclase
MLAALQVREESDMAQLTEQDPQIEQYWHQFLNSGFPDENRMRRIFGALPTNPRCKQCYAPFKGIGGALVRTLYNKRPSSHNPLICNVCEEFAARFPGGAEVELTMLFADIRGSTTLAEQMSPRAFSQVINRFYQSALDVLVHHDAIIDRLAGDEMIGYFVRGFAGPEHTRQALRAAQELLQVTGHADPSGPWVPLGVGVNRGTAFFGAVGTKDGVIDITALGDEVNTTARLASQARAGQILISEPAFQAAGIDLGDPQKITISLKRKDRSGGRARAWGVTRSVAPYPPRPVYPV